ncbi:P-loop containing nucleoside triphosphate hydrolase protein [Wallemia mellicola]|uniref:P-loop containing nucleoside triphosphate hydrolase protein n=1 Tax=Wallemia mellicola TaxID=1708541 RepID=A0A4V6TR84_9BASI|nr:P-loop containing nucleoside triphosphate hydrolase protein [Wallemia mellicola]TIC25365.1 P-loop containing nucleoside triphosphate hydrolase protein [Wallemia mellicola]
MSSIEWNNICYRDILKQISGDVKPAEILAVMGPSGSGKTTLLECISRRKKTSSGNIACSSSTSFCEQEDALLGVLTVKETLKYSARLSVPHATSQVIEERVNAVIDGLGLHSVLNNRIGTPIQRGISGGQKRRVSIACSLVQFPDILFLDEPTSGLDISTAHQVMTAIKRMAVTHNIAVVATIHSPNWEIFTLFDKLLLLAKGETVFNSKIDQLVPYFEELGYNFPKFSNPVDVVMELINTDFEKQDSKSIEEGTSSFNRLESLVTSWKSHEKFHVAVTNTSDTQIRSSESLSDFVRRTYILSERNLFNYSRNLLAYGVRMGMYVGLGVLLATIWVNLKQSDDRLNDRLSVHFFSVAFLSFMSVAGIPSYLEERAVLRRERANGLYGPLSFTLAQTVMSLPFLFICVVIFTVICYFSIGLHPGASHFFKWMAILYLCILNAEFQSLLVASIFPVFVTSLAIAAFINGFFMCVQGYFIRAVNLPRFWYYWAHWIDYQTFGFAILTKSDLLGLKFECNGSIEDDSCQCSYPSTLISQEECAVSGEDVLRQLDYDGISITLYSFILVIIIIVYRVLFYIVVKYNKA